MREIAVPLTVVGDTALVGATADLHAGPALEELIAECERTWEFANCVWDVNVTLAR